MEHFISSNIWFHTFIKHQNLLLVYTRDFVSQFTEDIIDYNVNDRANSCYCGSYYVYLLAITASIGLHISAAHWTERGGDGVVRTCLPLVFVVVLAALRCCSGLESYIYTHRAFSGLTFASELGYHHCFLANIYITSKYCDTIIYWC